MIHSRNAIIFSLKNKLYMYSSGKTYEDNLIIDG